MEFSINELRELVAALDQTDVSELILKSGEFELILRKPGMASVMAAPPGVAPGGVGEVPPVVAPAPAVGIPPEPTAAAAPPPPLVADPHLLEITSPMVGTFYRAPAPDEPPFVEVGDRIQLGQTVCIIEAMKLMNELEAEVAGEVVEILVENGCPIEFGQPLMRLRPLR